MKAIRNLFDKAKPHFEKGGKFHMFKSVFGGFETFLFVPNHTNKNGTHIRDYVDLKRTMVIVVVALIPALLFGMYNIGYQHNLAVGETADFWQAFFYGFIRVLPIIVVSYVTGLGIEFATAQMRGHEINEGFLVSGMLIPLVMPINTPLWMIAVATAFAVVFGKEVFGGTGMNILNPALTARAFLFFAYPSFMSGDSVWTRIGAGNHAVDGFSGATAMAQAAQEHPITYSVSDMFFGFIPGSIGETSTLAILIGAAILLWTGVGSWKIMLSAVVGGTVMGLLLNIFAVNDYMAVPFWEHFIMGGFAFGVVFMATDPVSAAQTPKGKWIYGFLIGFLAILIRVVNPAYPEGMMLAILLMNVFAPLIDHYVVEGNIKRRMKRATVKA
jgi:Na+-transporting NADH:ubiquinone oxidoreductase subunit B